MLKKEKSSSLLNYTNQKSSSFTRPNSEIKNKKKYLLKPNNTSYSNFPPPIIFTMPSYKKAPIVMNENIEKEQLYESNILLKKNINKIKKELAQTKFQVIKKGMELQEKEKLILNCIKENDIDIENQNSYKMEKTRESAKIILYKDKYNLIKSKYENECKENQKLKANINYTKYKEYEIENNILNKELSKIKTLYEQSQKNNQFLQKKIEELNQFKQKFSEQHLILSLYIKKNEMLNSEIYDIKNERDKLIKDLKKNNIKKERLKLSNDKLKNKNIRFLNNIKLNEGFKLKINDTDKKIKELKKELSDIKFAYTRKNVDYIELKKLCDNYEKKIKNTSHHILKPFNYNNISNIENEKLPKNIDKIELYKSLYDECRIKLEIYEKYLKDNNLNPKDIIKEYGYDGVLSNNNKFLLLSNKKNESKDKVNKELSKNNEIIETNKKNEKINNNENNDNNKENKENKIENENLNENNKNKEINQNKEVNENKENTDNYENTDNFENTDNYENTDNFENTDNNDNYEHNDEDNKNKDNINEVKNINKKNNEITENEMDKLDNNAKKEKIIKNDYSKDEINTTKNEGTPSKTNENLNKRNNKDKKDNTEEKIVESNNYEEEEENENKDIPLIHIFLKNFEANNITSTKLEEKLTNIQKLFEGKEELNKNEFLSPFINLFIESMNVTQENEKEIIIEFFNEYIDNLNGNTLDFFNGLIKIFQNLNDYTNFENNEDILNVLSFNLKNYQPNLENELKQNDINQNNNDNDNDNNVHFITFEIFQKIVNDLNIELSDENMEYLLYKMKKEVPEKSSIFILGYDFILNLLKRDIPEKFFKSNVDEELNNKLSDFKYNMLNDNKDLEKVFEDKVKKINSNNKTFEVVEKDVFFEMMEKYGVVVSDKIKDIIYKVFINDEPCCTNNGAVQMLDFNKLKNLFLNDYYSI